jgi:hypothetical protein
VPNLVSKRISGSWSGQVLYVFVAFLVGFMNSRVFNSAVDASDLETSRDLKTITAGFTGVSFLGVGLQFLYARAIGSGQKATWRTGALMSAVAAVTAFVISFTAITATIQFQAQIASLVALAIFFSIFTSAQFASLLINKRWIAISSLAFLGAFLRMIFWRIDLFSSSLHGFIWGIVFSNLIVYCAVLFLTTLEKLPAKSGLRITSQLVPVGILTGLMIIVTGGGIARRSALGHESLDYSDAGLIGRQIFYLVVVIAYAAFPALCNSPLYSQELGKSYRQGQFASTLLAVGSGIILWKVAVNNDHTDVVHRILLIQIFAWVLFSISLTPLLYFVAHNSRVGLAVLFPASVMVVAQFWASSAFELSLAFLLSSFLLFILALVPALVRSRPVVHAIRKSDVSCKQLTREAVTVVVPSYNPGARVLETIRDIHGAFEEVGRKVLVVAVSDGSTDESVRLLDSLHEDWFVHISLPTNVGKGGALLAGFQVVSTSYVGFIDADGDIPPGLLPSMFGTAREENADVVFGSKWHPESDVVVSSMRRLVSKAHHVLQMMLFKLDISDTQAGIKVYKTNSLQDVLHTLKETGFSLDLEIFVSMSAHKLNNFIEMPVVITRSGESTISIRTAIGAFLDMLRIFWRSRIALRYDSLAYLTDQKTSEKTK